MRVQLREGWQLLRRAKPQWGRLIAAMVAQFTANLLVLAVPLLLGKLVDGTLAGRTLLLFGKLTEDNHSVGWILAAVMLAHGTLVFCHYTWFNQAAEQGLARLRALVYGHLISVPMSFFARQRVGELTSRLTGDLALLHDLLAALLPAALRHSVTLVGSIGLMVWTSGSLTLTMLGLLPVLVLAAAIVGRRIRRSYREAREKLGEASIVAEETLQNIATVKAFTNEGYERHRYQSALDHFVERILSGIRFRAGFIASVLLALYGVMLLTLWLGDRKIGAGAMTPGELTRFILYSGFAAAAMTTWAEIFGATQRILGATHRIAELMNEPVESLAPAPDAEPKPSIRLRGEIQFDKVSFAYPSRPEATVLRRFSLHIGAGEKLALVGASGAGKSTVAALLLRLYEVQDGRVFIDGQSVSEFDLVELRRQMAVVPQEVLLFGGTIAENIAYGKPGATLGEVESAARQANAHEFIEKLPNGYQTPVGDRGFQLSGGQRQRVAIARAILKDPAILILDEATSALDPEGEQLVHSALAKLMEGRTTLIVAHRLSTVRGADRIAVLEDGEVVELGTHAELLAKERGLYRTLWELQSHRGA